MNRNALFAGGLRPHHYCLPVLKAEAHRAALLEAVATRHAAHLPRHRQRAASRRRQGERLRLRRHLLRARRASSCTRRPSKRPARSSSSRRSPPSTARTSTACRATRARSPWSREPWQVPAHYPFGADELVPLRAGEQVPLAPRSLKGPRRIRHGSPPDSERVPAGGRGGAHGTALPRLPAGGDRRGDAAASTRRPMRCSRSPRCSSTWTPTARCGAVPPTTTTCSPSTVRGSIRLSLVGHRHRPRIIRCGRRCPSATRCSGCSARSATRCAPTTAAARSWSGHNAAFDLGFLNAAVARADVKRNPFHPFSCFDTATLAGAALGQTVLAKAVTVAGLEWDADSAHSARYDAERSADIFCLVCNRLRDSHAGGRGARAGSRLDGRVGRPPRRKRTCRRRSSGARRAGGAYFAAPASASSFFSSPLLYISSAMSQPPTSSPFTYSCG